MMPQPHHDTERKEQREMRIAKAARRQAGRKRKPAMPRGWGEQSRRKRRVFERADCEVEVGCRSDAEEEEAPQ
jgi:hypothetical protein